MAKAWLNLLVGKMTQGIDQMKKADFLLIFPYSLKVAAISLREREKQGNEKAIKRTNLRTISS